MKEMDDLDHAPDTAAVHGAPPAVPDLSVLLIRLLKGVLYREDDEHVWSNLLRLQPRVREHAAVLLLDLVIDEAEGHAFLKGRPDAEDDDPGPRLPRLVVRRPLTYAVSLMLALLRRKLAEFDAGGGETRLVLDRDELVDLVRVFLPEGPNEAKLIDQVDNTIQKVVDLGFLHRLKPTAGGGATDAGHYEVRRILKAYVDAQWLAEFDARLERYRDALSKVTSGRQDRDG